MVQKNNAQTSIHNYHSFYQMNSLGSYNSIFMPHHLNRSLKMGTSQIKSTKEASSSDTVFDYPLLPIFPLLQLNVVIFGLNRVRFLCMNQLNPRLYSPMVSAGRMKSICLHWSSPPVKPKQIYSLIRQLDHRSTTGRFDCCPLFPNLPCTLCFNPHAFAKGQHQ